ncbi:MAG: glycosyltransferase [Gemmatimonadota bacterium]
MHVTIAICTWNRAKLLRRTLERMTALAPPRASWQLLVVNNASTDETDQVLEEFGTRLPLRRIWEAVPGLSNARNAAVAAAEGDYIIWTDDDVLVDARWLSAYEEAFSLRAEADFFGGPVSPWFEGTPPAWLTEAWAFVSSAYAARELGDQPFPFTHEVVPYGANYAVRLDVQRRHRYDPALGRVGTGTLSGEEVGVLRAILKERGSGWWVPGARVEHFIPAARQTVSFIRKYYAGIGEQAARADIAAPSATWFGRPRWVWRQAIQRELAWRSSRAAGGPARSWAADLVAAAIAQGRLRVSR